MALQMYEATPGQNEYQKVGFDIVLTIVTVLCVCLSLGSTLLGTPWVQQAYEAHHQRREARRLKAIQSKPRRWSGKNPMVEMSRVDHWNVVSNPLRGKQAVPAKKVDGWRSNPMRMPRNNGKRAEL